ncbi:MAG: GNAT family N-acetyltransferase [Xenococcus sp. MO_188.B8]|nr:GNAT family N-acetyltransferase [Xenococcus sp. MO_188.B8]
MKYSYKIYNSIQELDLNHWQQVINKSKSKVFMDVRFLLTMEKSLNNDSRFWHIIFYDDTGAPHACASLSSFQTDLSIIADKTTKKFVNFLRKIFPSFLHIKILFSGLPVSLGQNHLLFIPEANQTEIIKLLNRIIQEIAITEKAKLIVYKEFDSKQSQQLDVLLQLGYLRAESLPMNYFQPNFGNFNDYYAALRSNYRKHIRKSQDKFANAGMYLMQLQDPEEIIQIYTPEVHKLYEAVVNKSKTRLETLPLTFFHELARNFPYQVFLTLAYYQKKIVGFMYSLEHKSIAYCLFCGFDFSLNSETDLYFNLAYGALEEALNFELSDIEVGQTADAFKARLGCYQKPLYIYVKGVGSIFNLLVKTLSKFLFPAPLKTPSHKIFKSISS